MIVCDKCRSLDLVTIKRAQYDALVAAAILRAAGVEMEEDK